MCIGEKMYPKDIWNFAYVSSNLSLISIILILETEIPFFKHLTLPIIFYNVISILLNITPLSDYKND